MSLVRSEFNVRVAPELTHNANWAVLSILRPIDLTRPMHLFADPYYLEAVLVASRIDEELTQLSIPRDTSAVVSELFTASHAQQTIQRAADANTQFLKEDERRMLVGLLYGTTEILTLTRDSLGPLRHDQLQVALGVRSNGTTLHGLELFGQMDKSRLEDASLIAVSDDLGDEGRTTFGTAAAILLVRNPHLDMKQIQGWLEQIDSPPNGFESVKEIYDQLALTLLRNNIAIGMAISKNAPLLDALKEAAHAVGGDAGKAQLDLIANVDQLNPNNWISGRRIDTGIHMADIIRELYNQYPTLWNNPQVAAILNRLHGYIWRAGASSTNIWEINGATNGQKWDSIFQFGVQAWKKQLEAL